MADFDPLALSEQLFAGELSTDERHPIGSSLTHQLAPVADRTAYVESLANVTVFDTDDGLCLIDTGGHVLAPLVQTAVRGWTGERVDTAVYTHGHIDHVMGTGLFDEESEAEGWPRPRVIGHADVAPRFERYRLTGGYNTIINRRQFGLGEGLQWPTEFRHPDVTYTDHLDVRVGGLDLHLHHARGETDDHTWVWVPDRRVLCTGDLFIWAVPNAGNPQKVQRYARDWSLALREMATLGAELLIPGHGLPIAGTERVRTALDDTAGLLESLEDQTVAMMNEGATLNEIIHTVTVPEHLAGRPYLQPVYDEPEFIVRNVWRLYGGWYEGDPAMLKPARDAAVAAEIASLSGGAGRLAARAVELADVGEWRLAGHFAELAVLADPDDPATHRARSDVYGRRADAERSTMAKGVFSEAAADSRRRIDEQA